MKLHSYRRDKHNQVKEMEMDRRMTINWNQG